jgi:hypothetical protein
MNVGTSSLTSVVASLRLHPARVAGVTALLAGVGAAAWFVTQGRRVEEPAYAVERREGDFEVRRYAPRVVAETEVSGSRDEASKEGFRRIAGFIFGGNHRRARIAMTAPVTQRAAGETIAMTAPVSQRGAGDRWTVAFTMPSAHALRTLPTPDDARVTLRLVAEQRVAVVRFANATSDAAVRARTEALLRWAAERGLRTQGDAELNRYDPPWTPPFLRRNEVWVALES